MARFGSPKKKKTPLARFWLAHHSSFTVRGLAKHFVYAHFFSRFSLYLSHNCNVYNIFELNCCKSQKKNIYICMRKKTRRL